MGPRPKADTRVQANDSTCQEAYDGANCIRGYPVPEVGDRGRLFCGNQGNTVIRRYLHWGLVQDTPKLVTMTPTSTVTTRRSMVSGTGNSRGHKPLKR